VVGGWRFCDLWFRWRENLQQIILSEQKQVGNLTDGTKQTRRDFLRAGTGTFAGLALAKGSKPAEMHGASRDPGPNILIIFPDAWRGMDLGCAGNPDVRTPHIDRIASEGVLFPHTFANTPLCAPARANIYTGMYASRNRMVCNDLRLRESVTTMHALFSQAGYQTGLIGKWHLDGGPHAPGFVPPGIRRHGIKYWAAMECNHNYFYNWYFRDSGVAHLVTRYEPEAWIDLAIEFLHEKQDAPFFLTVSIGAPHRPFLMPQQYLGMYSSQDLKVRPNWVKGVGGGGRKDLAAQYAAMTAIDDQVGRLMKALESLGLKENTIVFFFSDHGEMLGSHGEIWKRLPWEESIRVPGIIRWPRKIKGGEQRQALFTHLDFAPTLLSLCGINVPVQMQGADLSKIVLGSGEGGASSAFFQVFGPGGDNGLAHGWRAVRTQQYMYARTQAGPWLLYDLEKDPYEMDNLANTPRGASVQREFDDLLGEWMRKIGDSWSLDFGVPVEKGQLSTYRTFYTLDEYYQWARVHPNLEPHGPFSRSGNLSLALAKKSVL
jgi:arylsulfatase A-like enzyme